MNAKRYIRPFFAMATALTAALMLISLAEPLLSFEATRPIEEDTIGTPGAKWSQAMELLPATAYLWLLVVYAAGSVVAGYLCWTILRSSNLLKILSVTLGLLMLINLSFTPNPIWFWPAALTAISVPVFLPLLLHSTSKTNTP